MTVQLLAITQGSMLDELDGDLKHLIDPGALQRLSNVSVVLDRLEKIGVRPPKSPDEIANDLGKYGRTDIGTAADATAKDEAPLVVRRVLPDLKSDRLIALQKWLGYVVAVGENSFIGRLTDLTSRGEAGEEEAEFPIDDVPEEDREFLTPGAAFYWTIGYRIRRGGQRTRASEIVFRRAPVWQGDEIREAERISRQRMNEAYWDRD